MDSDKFDRIVLDLLYAELDELTAAAAKRHMEQSARARDIFAHLRATRQLGVLPAHAPPADFEAAVLEREARLLAELPVRQRLGRWVSKLAGYAMRPQLIMGALLLLMIGSSLMFVRARPGLHRAVQVTERGSPEGDVDLVLPLAPPPLPGELAAHAAAGPEAPRASEAGGSAPAAGEALGAAAALGADAGGDGPDPFEQALQIYRARGYAEAQRLFERLSRAGGKQAAEAALYAAISARNTAGCAAALPAFERVRTRFPSSPSARDALWRATRCQEQLGETEAARRGYEALLRVPSHARRAERALAALGTGAEPPGTR